MFKKEEGQMAFEVFKLVSNNSIIMSLVLCLIALRFDLEVNERVTHFIIYFNHSKYLSENMNLTLRKK